MKDVYYAALYKAVKRLDFCIEKNLVVWPRPYKNKSYENQGQIQGWTLGGHNREIDFREDHTCVFSTTVWVSWPRPSPSIRPR